MSVTDRLCDVGSSRAAFALLSGTAAQLTSECPLGQPSPGHVHAQLASLGSEAVTLSPPPHLWLGPQMTGGSVTVSGLQELGTAEPCSRTGGKKPGQLSH